MLRVALGLTGNRPDAEDLVQESLIRAYRAVAGFDGRHSRAWLLTILRRTYLNLQRRRRPDVVGDWELLTSHRPAFGSVSQGSAEQVVLDASLDGHLSHALDALDPRLRSTILLVDVHDLSYAEAAAALGVPVGTVMSRLSRARNRLRSALRHELLNPGGPR